MTFTRPVSGRLWSSTNKGSMARGLAFALISAMGARYSQSCRSSALARLQLVTARQRPVVGDERGKFAIQVERRFAGGIFDGDRGCAPVQPIFAILEPNDCNLLRCAEREDAVV